MDLAIVAGRVSTKDQADRGYSLPEQVSAGLAYVQERGYALADVPGFSNTDAVPARPGVFVEDFTGMSMDRPALDAMRDTVKQRGVKVIVYTETDRLSRKRIYGDLLEMEFEELGARVEYAIERFDDSDEGRLFKDLKKAVAEYDRIKILRRMRTGKAGRCKSGKVLISDRPPYGYRKSDDGATLIVCEKEAETVRRIFRWYIEGVSAYAIAARLNADHVPTYVGAISRERQHGWADSSIRALLACETYTGNWHHNKHHIERKQGQRSKKTLRPRSEWIGVPVPRIVDDETFALARARSEQNKANASRNRKRLYLFAGMLTCGGCGRVYSGSTSPGGAPRYRCGAKTCRDQYGERLCTMPYYTESALDAAIWPWLIGILRQPEQALMAAQARAEEQQDQARAVTDRLSRVEAKIADVKRRIANLDDEIEIETDDERRSALRERVARRVKERRDLEAEQAGIKAQLEQKTLTPERAKRVTTTCTEIARHGDDATPEKKREVYELANLRVRLEVKDGMKLVHVTCIVGEETLSIANVASRCNDHNTFTFGATLVIGAVR